MRLITVGFLVTLVVSSAFGGEEKPILEVERMVWCGPGWYTAIYASGFANRRIQDTCVHPGTSSRLIRLSKAQLKSLAEEIQRQHFCSLPKSIDPGITSTDPDVLSITVNLESDECKVSASELDQIKDRAIANRFMTVWNAITRVVPETAQ